MEIRLVHYVADKGQGEYLALLDEEESVFEYLQDGFSVHGVFQLTPHTSGDMLEALPVSRTFAEG